MAGESAPCHLIEIAFEDIGERDRAFEAIEKLLGEMGQIGTLSARTEYGYAKASYSPLDPAK